MFNTQKSDDQVNTEVKKFYIDWAGIGLDRYWQILRIFGIGLDLKNFLSLHPYYKQRLYQ